MKSIGLVLIATIAIGLFAMPATMAYFTGQHTFTGGADVQCSKCHGAIEDEFLNANNTVHESMICNDCHVTTNMNNASMNPADKTGHASIAVECMDCHDSAVFAGPQAGSTPNANGDTHDITSPDAAHGDWYQAALNDGNDDSLTPSTGANEVCIACHTHTAVEILWTSSLNGTMTYNQTSRTFEVVPIS